MVLCLLTAMLPAGCRLGSDGDSSAGPRLSSREQRLQDIYFALMGPKQTERYRTLRTLEERELYLKIIGVWPQYHNLDEARRKTIFRRKLETGMTANEVAMTIGPPARRRVIDGDGHGPELRYYAGIDSKPPFRILCFEDGRLTKWRRVKYNDYVLLMDKPIDRVMQVFE